MDGSAAVGRRSGEHEWSGSLSGQRVCRAAVADGEVQGLRGGAEPSRGRRVAPSEFKAVRESQGLKLAEVAERMGIDPPALSRLETGKMLNPTLATLHKWAEALEQKLDVDLSPLRGAVMKFHDCKEEALRRRIEFYGFQCSWCGNRPGKDFHHIQPECAGGSYEWSNLMWVCKTCHGLLDDFCSKHWDDPEQQARMREIRSCSIDATFQVCEGTINKRTSEERWNFGNVFEMGKTGKTTDAPRTADKLWQDLHETKKYMKIDSFLCLEYLRQFVAHRGEPTHCVGMDGKGPVVIAAPSLEALLERASELLSQDHQRHETGTREEARQAYNDYKRSEDEFFHTVFRPS